VPTPIELAETAVRRGRNKKRKNAIAAVLCGALPAAILTFQSSLRNWGLWCVGLIIGLIWANAFEYAYHRWLLHQPRTALGVEHREHHAKIGTPDEAEHVALISSPLNIVLLFAINGVPAFLITSLIGSRGILSGLFIGWAVYLIVTEEIHWRIHMRGWLPPGLRLARTHHLSHHDVPNSRYNVFLPLFDFLFESTGPG